MNTDYSAFSPNVQLTENPEIAKEDLKAKFKTEMCKNWESGY